MNDPLALTFFDRPVLAVARDLIGKPLIRLAGDGPRALRITEVEAYDGPFDLASHARFGRTARNGSMFGPPGTIYVYLCYGIHWMLNLACGPENQPSAILVRAAGGIIGPGRLARALGIDRALDGRPLGPATGLWVADAPTVMDAEVLATPRIGVAYAGEWAGKPWRFVLAERGGRPKR